jgi:hypothetical protein
MNGGFSATNLYGWNCASGRQLPRVRASRGRLDVKHPMQAI